MVARHRIVLAGLLLAVAALAVWALWSPGATDSPSPVVSGGGESAVEEDPPARSRPVPGPLPASLAGTEPDGALLTDASGAFVPSADALDLFDYYFSALGEEPEERIVARIERVIRDRVAPPDAALAFFDQYLVVDADPARIDALGELGALVLVLRPDRRREPIDTMAPSIDDVTSEGDFHYAPNPELTAALSAREKPASGDLASICAHWFVRAPQPLMPSLTMQDDRGELTEIRLSRISTTGRW